MADPAGAGGRPLWAAAAMAAACGLIAATSLMAKMLGTGTAGPALHPFQVSAGRFAFALSGLVIVAAIMRPSLAGARWPAHLGRSLSGWLGVTCMFAAAARMPLADATALTFLSPLVTMLLAVPLLGERIGPRRWTAAAVSLAGAVVLLQPGAGVLQAAALLALAAAGFLGLEAIFIKRLSDTEPPLRILLINNSIGTLVSGTAAISVWQPPGADGWAVLAALGLTMVCAQALFIQAMTHGRAGQVMPIMYMTLLFAALYDAVLFEVLPATASWIGAGLIVTGSVTVALLRR